MSIGKTSFLIHISQAGWPEDLVDVLSHFYIQLEMHEMRSRKHGEEILLIYQARVRLSWHDALKRGEGFDLSVINDKLLSAVSEEYWDQFRDVGRHVCSLPSLPF